LLGPRGSGKEEYAEQLAERFGLPMISIGALLKLEVDSGSSLGVDILKGQKGKRPVHDDLIMQVLQTRLREEDVAAGFVLEGGPRTDAQAKGIDAFLLRHGAAFAGVVLLKYDYDEFMEAMTGQRSCRECGSQFNIYTNPPVVERICDACGGRLHSRVDDREEKISRRLRDYESIEAPLAKYYEGRLKIVQGGFEQSRVFKMVAQAAEQLKKAAPEFQVSSIQKEEEVVMAKAEKKKKKAAPKKKAVAKKKVAPKKAVAKKAATPKKSAPGKKAAPKKAVVKKKVAAKKAAPKKAVAKKKVAAKKAAPKKAAVKKKVPAKKAAPKKAAVKKKVAAKKAAPKKAAVKKKAAAKKAAPKKAAVKKAAAKKAAPKKAAVKKKVAAKKAAPKKAAVKKKAAAKKAAPKKAVVKKKAAPKKAALKKKVAVKKAPVKVKRAAPKKKAKR